jgi:hypothetical protein
LFLLAAWTQAELRLDVQDGGKKYTVFPSTFAAGQESTFTISVYSKSKISLVPLSESAEID